MEFFRPFTSGHLPTTIAAPHMYRVAIDDILAIVVGAIVLIAFYRKSKIQYHPVYFERPQLSVHEKLTKSSATRNLAEKLEQIDAQLLIMWGSQSGTAESNAVKLGAELQQRFALKSLVVDISDYNPETLLLTPPTIPFIILVSTYGEGGPADNCVRFVEWLQTVDSQDLQNHQYAILGFGNSNYIHYNRVADLVDERLQLSGATRMTQLRRIDALSDESAEICLEWKSDLFAVFRNRFSIQERITSYEPRFKITEAQGSHANENLAFRQGQIFESLPVVGGRQIMTSEGQCCLHFDVDLSQYPKLKYRTGDHLLLWAANATEEVDQLLSVCGLHGNNLPIHIQSMDSSSTDFPAITTSFELLQHHVEVCAPMTRDTVARLVEFAPSQDAGELLQDFAANKEKFARLGRVTLRDIISLTGDLQWKIPLEFLLEVLPRMKPRYYSLSSSSIEEPRQVSITASVHSPPKGVATTYLQQLYKQINNITFHEKDAVPKFIASVKTSPFKLPLTNSVPIILIAAGTGLAPFRAFIRERAAIHRMGKHSGKVMLFFGCRRQEDFIYLEELDALQEVLHDQLIIHSAFSRSGLEKMYVQDKVREHASEICDSLVEDHATLYICGSVSMARSAGEEIGNFFMSKNQVGLDDWIQLKDRKLKQRKWQEDVW